MATPDVSHEELAYIKNKLYSITRVRLRLDQTQAALPNTIVIRKNEQINNNTDYTTQLGM